MLQINYNKNGKKLEDHLMDNGAKGKIFVNINDGNKPYIITNFRQYSTQSMSMSEVWSGGTWVGAHLNDHLNDPEYDPSMINEDTPSHWMVDYSKLGRELARTYIDAHHPKDFRGKVISKNPSVMKILG